MSEDFTSLAVAYLLGELDEAGRARFEARLASDPTLVAELKAITNTLAVVAESGTGTASLATKTRQEMFDNVLRASCRTHLPAWFKKSAWPLAAAILLGINVAQWLHHRRQSRLDESVEASSRRESTATALPATRNTGVMPVAAKTLPAAAATRATEVPAAPSIRQTMTFTLSQTTITASATTAASRENAPPQQGALELRGLPRVEDDRSLYLWAKRAGADHYEPVGEVPRPLYGSSGMINYQLRPGTGRAVHFLVTVEQRARIPTTPSSTIICSGP